MIFDPQEVIVCVNNRDFFENKTDKIPVPNLYIQLIIPPPLLFVLAYW